MGGYRTSLIKEWKETYPKIHTYRVSMVPLSYKIEESIIKKLSTNLERIDVRWLNVSIDPSHKEKCAELFDYAYLLLKEYTNIFVHIIGVKQGIIDDNIFEYSAKLIQKVSKIDNTGEVNFRLGISANVIPDGSFFPFSMSSGEYGFSIALELAQDINRVIKNNINISLDILKDSIINMLDP
jgi:cytochrome oxidase Cu insertion factor (SCO1/SenC/PrrC family)